MKEAIFWQKIDENKLKCLLCNHFCTLKEGDKGICGVRVSINGKLYSLNYGKLVAENIDPIEKKPFFHFLPGSTSYSIASAGCNFKCLLCQNYNITDLSNQYSHHNKIVTPTEILSAALSSGCKSISYTYTEPTIF